MVLRVIFLAQRERPAGPVAVFGSVFSVMILFGAQWAVRRWRRYRDQRISASLHALSFQSDT